MKSELLLCPVCDTPPQTYYSCGILSPFCPCCNYSSTSPGFSTEDEFEVWNRNAQWAEDRRKKIAELTDKIEEMTVKHRHDEADADQSIGYAEQERDEARRLVRRIVDDEGIDELIRDCEIAIEHWEKK